MWPNPQETADLVTFIEEILNGKLHFLCDAYINITKGLGGGKEVYKKFPKIDFLFSFQILLRP